MSEIGNEAAESIDVLLPFYGDVGLMQEAVLSILAQTDPDWRLIIVDDHQPDATVAHWVSSLNDQRISYHRNQVNLGANANYGRALSLSVADLVVFMGADDRMLPHFVERARRAFRRAGARASMYQPAVRVIDGSGSPSTSAADRVKRWLRRGLAGEEISILGGERLARSLLLGNWTYFPSLCWRRSAIADEGFDPNLHVAQDLALILRLTARGDSLILDNEVTFEYRRHALSDSAVKTGTAQRFQEEAQVFATAAGLCDDRGWSKAARAARWHLTSRANALLMLMLAVRRRHWSAARLMLGHTLSRTTG